MDKNAFILNTCVFLFFFPITIIITLWGWSIAAQLDNGIWGEVIMTRIMSTALPFLVTANYFELIQRKSVKNKEKDNETN